MGFGDSPSGALADTAGMAGTLQRSGLEAVSPHLQALRSALNGALANPTFNELPCAASLGLALRFLETAVTSAGPRDESIEDSVQSFLTWIPPRTSRLNGAANLGINLGRPSLAFRSALALLYLPQCQLEPELDRLLEECQRGGFLDGLCLTGLGGSESANPINASMLEDLAHDPGQVPWAASEPVGALGRMRGRSMTMPNLRDRVDMLRQVSGQDFGATSDPGSDLMWKYVSKTGDVQSAALLFCHAAHLSHPPMGLQRCFSHYVALLARWRLHRQRVDLHGLITARLPQDDNTRGRGPVMFCLGCNGSLTGPLTASPGESATDFEAVTRVCPTHSCQRPAPACAVCLLPMLVIRSRSDDKRPARLEVDSWAAWCQSCQHGGHMAHLEEWFETHVECPVAGCDCQCGSLL